MEFFVYGRREIEAGVVMRMPYVLISIFDPHSRKPRPRFDRLCREVLYLRFHDAEPSAVFQLPPDIRLMSRRQARAIWQFVSTWRERVQAIAVHCEAGMSRSPAIAAAVCSVLGDSDARFFRDYQPNQYIYQLLISTRPAELG